MWTTTNPTPDPLEDLLAELLSLYEAGGPEAVEPLLARHPRHEHELRRHLSRLLGLGLLAGDEAAPPPEPRALPDQLGDFRLLRRLGGGGMGVVHLAEQRSLARLVALKLIRPELLWFDGARERFRREVDSIARLDHPGIVPVYAAGEDQSVPWLAMQYVPGATLDEVLRVLAGTPPERLEGRDLERSVRRVLAERPLPSTDTAPTPEAPTRPAAEHDWPTACCRVVRDVGLALQHAHRRGVLHRDVKPANIVLTADGRALLLDFGLASVQGSARLTASHSTLGSPAYMSPEQLRGDRDLDARADLYSLGLTLYELLTHHAPFALDSAEELRERVLSGSAPPPRHYNAAVGRDLDVVCRKAIAPERSARYRDVQAFVDDLDNVLASRPIQAQPPSALRRLRRWARRHPARATAAVAAFLLLFVAPSLFVLQQRAAHEEILRANRGLQRANAETTQALAVARRDRDRGREAVDVLLEQVANETLFDVPRMQHVRRRLLESARDFHERFLADGGDDPEARAQVAESALQVGFIDNELGRARDAERAAERALELTGTLAARPDASITTRLLHARARTARAKLLQQHGELNAAHEHLNEAAALTERIWCDAPGSAEAASHRLAVERTLILVLRQLGEHASADQRMQVLDAVWSDLQGRQPSPDENVQAFHQYFCALSDHALATESTTDADATLARCEALIRSAPLPLEELPGEVQLAHLRTEIVRSQLAARTGDRAAAERHLHRAIDGASPLLARNPDHANALRSVAAAQNGLMLLLSDDPSRAPECEQVLASAIATLRRLEAADPDIVENRANLAISMTNLGSMRLDAGDHAAARELFVEARERMERAVERVPTRESWHACLYNIVWFFAQACGELGDHTNGAAAAMDLAALRPDDARTQRIAAGLLAVATSGVASDPALDDERRTALDASLRHRAMELLRRAAKLGCTDVDWLRDGPAFAPLRDDAGFETVLREFERNHARAAPGVR